MKSMEKTETQSFIEDAIAGDFLYADGFEYSRAKSDRYLFINNAQCRLEIVTIHELLLRPDFWQAVGKTRGWDRFTDVAGDRNTPEYANWFPYSWGWRQHRFIDHRADGKTIEEALAAISQKV